MANSACTRSSLACAAVFASVLLGQQTLTPPADLPTDRGVYYRAGAVWEPLQRTDFLPFEDGDLAWMLSVGRRHLTAEIPGPQALVRAGSARPVFYVRGFSPANGMYLVRTERERDFREVKMNMDRHVLRGPRFKDAELVPFDLEAAGPDTVTLRPRADLKPGEYVILTAVGPSYRWLHFAYGFGVPGANP